MYKKHTSQQGVAIIISILFVAVILSIVFSLSAVFIPKLRSAAEIKSSVPAAYAAESGLEWCLYKNRKAPAPAPQFDNGASFLLNPADCSGAVPTVKSLGTYRGVTRAFELTF